MHALANLLARSNSAAGVSLVRQFGCDRDLRKEREAGRTGDAAPFDYCHVVLGVRGAPPRHFGGYLRLHRPDPHMTWLSGTYGNFMRALLDERMDPTARSGFCGVLQRGIDGLEPFGNPAFLAIRKGLEVPTGRAALQSAGSAEGGIFVLTADRQTEIALGQAGAYILDRAAPGTTKPWTECGLSSRVADNAPIIRIGTLMLPLAGDSVTESDLKLLRPFADAYDRLQRRVTNRDLATLLSSEFETASLLVAADRGVFISLRESNHPPAHYVAQSAIGALDAPDDPDVPEGSRSARSVRRVE